MSEREKEWHSLASKLVRKINFGWLLQFLTPFLVVASLVLGVAIITLRTLHVPVQNIWFLVGSAVVVAVVIVGSWLMAKRRFIPENKGLVRLEESLSLKNALTAADHGVGKWPTPPAEKDAAIRNAGFTWRWEMVMTPFLIAAISIAASLLIPIPDVEAAANLPPQEPSAWEKMEEVLATLEDQEVIEEEEIESVREKIDELRNQPEEEWFGHASMEATDTLRETLQRDMEELGREMETIERDLNALQNFAAQMSEKAKEKVLKEFEEALKNMELGQMQLSEELLEKLKSIDPKSLAKSQMGNMTKEEMDQLREQMKKAAQAMKQGGLGKGGEMPAMAEMSPEMKAWLQQMMGQGQGDGPDGEGPGGRGGLNRGPGHSPMFFGDETDLKTSNIEQIKNQDMSKAAPGELLAVGETEHEIDKTKVGPREAGAVKSTGKGGDRVWRESLMPDEKAVLKRYFK